MRRLSPTLAFIIALGAGLAALNVVAACSSDGVAGLGKSGKKRTATGKGAGSDDDDSGSSDTHPINNTGELQVKDLNLLKNSIKSCMGEGMSTIQAGMLLPKLTGDAALKLVEDPNEKFAFLLPTAANAVGADIVDAERGNLVDLSHSSRTSIASDSLTDTYLRSLETIGNVVAYNCDASKAECSCGTVDQAREMLTRCLPSLDPKTKEMEEAASLLSGICKKGDGGMRKAVASMIASYAFAAAR